MNSTISALKDLFSGIIFDKCSYFPLKLTKLKDITKQLEAFTTIHMPEEYGFDVPESAKCQLASTSFFCSENFRQDKRVKVEFSFT